VECAPTIRVATTHPNSSANTGQPTDPGRACWGQAKGLRSTHLFIMSIDPVHEALRGGGCPSLGAPLKYQPPPTRLSSVATTSRSQLCAVSLRRDSCQIM